MPAVQIPGAGPSASRQTITLSEIGVTLAASLDQRDIVQKVTDLATAVTRAEFGAFFYNEIDAKSGEAYRLYTLSGVSKEAFEGFPQPRATAIFAPTFHGEGVVRSTMLLRTPATECPLRITVCLRVIYRFEATLRCL